LSGRTVAVRPEPSFLCVNVARRAVRAAGAPLAMGAGCEVIANGDVADERG